MAGQEVEVLTAVALPPKLEGALNRFIDASYPPFYLSERLINDAGNPAILAGRLALAVSAIDFTATAYGNLKFSADELREGARERMQTEAQGINQALSHNPNTITVCRETELVARGGVCVKSESYDLRNEEGVVRFVTDQLAVAEDPTAAEKQALTGALPEPDGLRTEAFDSELISGLEDGMEKYVAAVQDQVRPETNPYSAELLVAGLPLLLIALAVKNRLTSRLSRQKAEVVDAQITLQNYRSWEEENGTAQLSRGYIENIKLASGWTDRIVLTDDWGRKDIRNEAKPNYGGQKARDEKRKAVQQLLKKLAKPQPKAS